MSNKLEYVDWFDSTALMHLAKNPDITNSENGPLFTAEFYKLYQLCYGKKHSLMHSSISTVNDRPGQYNPSGEWVHKDSKDAHFSHDNMTGLYCMYYMSFKSVPTHLPVITKYVKHPRDILFFLYCHTLKYDGFLVKVLQHFLLTLPCLAMLVSCYQLYKVRNGNKIFKTDGKLLTWLRCTTFGLNKTLWCAEKILKFRKKWKSWDAIFGAYFNRTDHPINQMASRLYHREF